MMNRTDKSTQIATVKAWSKSEMTAAEFAAERGINPNTLRSWKFRAVSTGEVEAFEEPKAPAKAPKVEAVKPAIEVEVKREAKQPARAHAQLVRVLRKVKADLVNLLIVGPAGSGKTTLAAQVAESLGLDFGVLSLSGGANESHLFGRLAPDATGAWSYSESPFVRIYRNGGVFLLDEIDAADPNVLVSANAALANGFLVVPATGERVERHVDCVIMSAANTFGSGADAMYVGRNALDAATLDRFVCALVMVDYDRELERAIALDIASVEGEALLARIWGLRDSVASNKIRRIVGTRAIIAGCKLLKAGDSVAEIISDLTIAWSTEEKRKAGLA